MKLNMLISIEEEIENNFIILARLEDSGLNTSYEYEEKFKVISDLVNKEKALLSTLSSEDIINFRKQVLSHCNKQETSLSLGYLANSIYQRLLNIFNSLLGSELYDYAIYLRYDLNQIIFSFLDYLINNPAYEEIKKDLIFYKYNLLYMNHLSEEDFLQTRDIATISIESKSFKTDFNSELIFVDKSVLILEGREHADFIEKYGEDLNDNNNHFALVVISILELIARLVLSENEILRYLEQDFNYLLEDENIPLEVKNLIQEMLIILETLKTRINVAR